MIRGSFSELYVHVPFCNGKCGYCAFYSEPVVEADSVSLWLYKLESDMAAARDKCAAPLSTVYFGGGTPAALGTDSLEKLFSLVRSYFVLSENTEFSIECNPESLTCEKAALLASNVNRVSMGVQTFSQDKRRVIGRRGDPAAVEKALSLLRNAGIANIGFDLIFGLPGQTLEEWKTELETALAFGIKHLSAYSLSLEPGTPLANSNPKLDDDAAADMWEFAGDFMAGAGMPRYEVSNYAVPGFECAHNMNVWHGARYLGLGPSAVSFDGSGRFEEASPLARWLNGVQPRPDPIPDAARRAEIFIMGLRTVRGWRADEFRNAAGFSWNELWPDAIRENMENGLLTENADSVAPTAKGLAFWNDLAESFIE